MANTNAQNLLLSIMARGGELNQAQANALGVPQLAGKSSAILPYYLADIEKATGANAGALALALQKAAPTVGDYSSVIAPYLAQASQARNLAGQVLSGDMTKQMLSEAQPVESARMDVANVQKNTALEALDKTLNQIDDIQARKGYSGDSYGNRLARFNARAGILGTAAANVAGARLTNAEQEQGIRQQGRALQLSNLTTPETLAQGEIGMKTAPTTAASGVFNASMLPLSDFNIGNHPFTEQNLPTVDLTSKTGLALSGLASNGNSALNYGLNKYFQSLNTPQGTWSGESVPANQGQDWGAISGGADAGAAAGDAAAADAAAASAL